LKPGYVRTLEDYWLWVDTLAGESGGWLDDAALIVRPLEPFPGSGIEDWVGLLVSFQRLTFADGSALWFRMNLDDDLVLAAYSFHYQARDDTLIWRKCNGPGHESEVGGRVHIHRNPSDPDEVEPYHEVDLEEALQEVHAFMNAGFRP
jgi:hypothetical protein